MSGRGVVGSFFVVFRGGLFSLGVNLGVGVFTCGCRRSCVVSGEVVDRRSASAHLSSVPEYWG